MPSVWEELVAAQMKKEGNKAFELGGHAGAATCS